MIHKYFFYGCKCNVLGFVSTIDPYSVVHLTEQGNKHIDPRISYKQCWTLWAASFASHFSPAVHCLFFPGARTLGWSGPQKLRGPCFPNTVFLKLMVSYWIVSTNDTCCLKKVSPSTIKLSALLLQILSLALWGSRLIGLRISHSSLSTQREASLIGSPVFY